MSRLFLPILTAAVAAPATALAHAQEGTAQGLLDGLMHPVLGPEHLVAMVAVGLWGAQLGQPLLVALPIAFPMMMTVGALLAVAGAPLPGAAIGVAVSAVVLGGIVCAGWRAPVWAAVALVGVFAIFHGHSHGMSLPQARDPLAFGVGFVVATGLLHAAGIGIGEAARGRRTGRVVMQVCGAAVAGVGVLFGATAVGGMP